MTNEQKREIIKALAYGLDEATVAECNGVSLEDVHAVAAALPMAGRCSGMGKPTRYK